MKKTTTCFLVEEIERLIVSTQPPVQIQVGYPEFWTVILQKHEKFFAQTQTIGTTIDEMFGVGVSEPMHKVCRHSAKMVSNSLNAVLLLGMNGFGIDAIKIARTMLEAAVNIAASVSPIEAFRYE